MYARAEAVREQTVQRRIDIAHLFLFGCDIGETYVCEQVRKRLVFDIVYLPRELRIALSV